MDMKPIQFNFSKEAYDELSALKDELQAPSKSEVVRLALSVLGWVVEELKANHVIMVQREQGQAVELAFPFLRLKNKSKQPEPAQTAATG
jgi:hypothetical protein